jgi:hypothetical protein
MLALIRGGWGGAPGIVRPPYACSHDDEPDSDGLTRRNLVGVIPSLTSGLFDNSPLGWTVGSLLLGIVVFPVYLAKREELTPLAAATPAMANSAQLHRLPRRRPQAPPRPGSTVASAEPRSGGGGTVLLGVRHTA